MSWIQGYYPNWVEDEANARSIVSDWEQQWLGKTIDQTFVGWYVPDNEWFEDFPLLLMIGGNQVEICWQKFDSLSITKNQIEKLACISGDERIPYRSNALEPLNLALNKEIQGVTLGMSSCTLNGTVVAMIYSVEFDLGDSVLSIFNELDQNGVKFTPKSV